MSECNILGMQHVILPTIENVSSSEKMIQESNMNHYSVVTYFDFSH